MDILELKKQQYLDILQEARRRMMATGHWDSFPEMTSEHIEMDPDGEAFCSFTEENAGTLFIRGKSSFILHPLFEKELGDILRAMEKETYAAEKIAQIDNESSIGDSLSGKMVDEDLSHLITPDEDLSHLITPDEDLSWLESKEESDDRSLEDN